MAPALVSVTNFALRFTMFTPGDIVKQKVGTLEHCFEVIHATPRTLHLKPLFPALKFQGPDGKWRSVPWSLWKGERPHLYRKVNVQWRRPAKLKLAA